MKQAQAEVGDFEGPRHIVWNVTERHISMVCKFIVNFVTVSASGPWLIIKTHLCILFTAVWTGNAFYDSHESLLKLKTKYINRLIVNLRNDGQRERRPYLFAKNQSFFSIFIVMKVSTHFIKALWKNSDFISFIAMMINVFYFLLTDIDLEPSQRPCVIIYRLLTILLTILH